MERTHEKLGPPPHNITVIKGSAINTFSRAFVEWVTENQLARDFLDWCIDTYSPDEHYWSTLNDLYDNPFFKTPGGYKGHPDAKRYHSNLAVWVSEDPHHEIPCYGIIRHQLCIFSLLDLPFIKPRNSITINKFNISFDPIAYACMEELLEEKETNPRPIDVSTYRQVK